MDNSAETKKFHKQHFDSIQALRGIACLFVMLQHIRFINVGAFGVDVFFTISGFMAMFTTYSDTSCFLRKRFIRILPLYYLVTFITYFAYLFRPEFFASTNASPVSLVKSLFFIPFDIGGGVIQPLVRVGWTLNCEMLFYLLFFLSFKISHKYRGLIVSVLLLCLAITGPLLESGISLLEDGVKAGLSPIVSFYFNPIMLEFALGVLAYYVVLKLYIWIMNTENKSLCYVLCFFIPINICLMIILTFKGNIDGIYRVLSWGILAFFLLIFTILAGMRVKALKPLVFVGNISFSLYLVHYYPITFLDRMVFDFQTFNVKALLGALFSIAFCIVLAYVTWFLVEKKLSGKLKSLIFNPR